MYLHRLVLNLRNKEARRDVADSYEMHSTLCRVFSSNSAKCPPGSFLWRLEPEVSSDGSPMVLVQSATQADWDRIGVENWTSCEPKTLHGFLEKMDISPSLLTKDMSFRYRLRGNPSVCQAGKRIGLFASDSQEEWLNRQGLLRGFVPLSIQRSQEQMLVGRRRTGNPIKVYSVLFDGVLKVTEPLLFYDAVTRGMGHGKAMGLGLLSVFPL